LIFIFSNSKMPLEIAFDLALNDPLVRAALQPMPKSRQPATSLESPWKPPRPGPYDDNREPRPKGDGKGKRWSGKGNPKGAGKSKGKFRGSGRVPTDLQGGKAVTSSGSYICFGYNLKIIEEFKTNQLNIEWVLKARTLLGDSSLFIDQPSFFDRLAGNSEFRKQVMANKTDTEIRKTWEEDLHHFKLIRRKYLIYN
jgi:hypothetical protein